MTTQPQTTSDSQTLWAPRRTLTLEAARAHTRRIRVLRLLLLMVASSCIGLLVWEFVNQENIEVDDDDPTQSVKMVNPRYSGRTDDGLPFYLTAKEAVRATGDDTEVELVDPVMEFFRDAGTEKSVIVARRGVYDDERKILNLRMDVNLKTDDGYDCDTSHARFFAKSKNIEGDEPISCIGEFGSVKGNAYEILDNYETFIFKNGMSAVLESEE